MNKLLFTIIGISKASNEKNKKIIVTIRVVIGALLLSLFSFFFMGDMIGNVESPLMVKAAIIGHIWTSAALRVSASITGSAFKQIYDDYRMASASPDILSKFNQLYRTLPANVTDNALEEKKCSFEQKFSTNTEKANDTSRWLRDIFLIYVSAVVVLFLVLFLSEFSAEKERLFLLVSNTVLMFVPLVVVGMIRNMDRKLPGLKKAEPFNNSVFYSTAFICSICALYIIFGIMFHKTEGLIHDFGIFVSGFLTGAVTLQLIIANLVFDKEWYKKIEMFRSYIEE